MNMNEKRLEFLDEMVEYYSANPKERRCIKGGTCKYSPEYLNLPNSEGCAIGRKLPKEVARRIDIEIGEIDIDSLIIEHRDLIPDEMIELGAGFLYAVQGFHDIDHYWDENGLSEKGLSHLKYLKDKYVYQ